MDRGPLLLSGCKEEWVLVALSDIRLGLTCQVRVHVNRDLLPQELLLHMKLGVFGFDAASRAVSVLVIILFLNLGVHPVVISDVVQLEL